MHQGKTTGKLQVLPEENCDGHVKPFQAGTEADRGIAEASTFEANVCELKPNVPHCFCKNLYWSLSAGRAEWKSKAPSAPASITPREFHGQLAAQSHHHGFISPDSRMNYVLGENGFILAVY